MVLRNWQLAVKVKTGRTYDASSLRRSIVDGGSGPRTDVPPRPAAAGCMPGTGRVRRSNGHRVPGQRAGQPRRPDGPVQPCRPLGVGAVDACNKSDRHRYSANRSQGKEMDQDLPWLRHEARHPGQSGDPIPTTGPTRSQGKVSAAESSSAGAEWSTYPRSRDRRSGRTRSAGRRIVR